MKFLIGLFVCFVLSLCGFALLASQKMKMKSSNHLSYIILQRITINSILLSGIYSIGYLFNLKGVWIIVLRILAVFLRFSLSCWIVCLFHQFSMLSPMTNTRSIGFYKSFTWILSLILSLCYFFFHLDTTNKDSFIIEDHADFWLYYIFTGCCLCIIFYYICKVHATSKSFGLSSSLSHLLLLRCILPFTLVCFLWICGVIDSLLTIFSHRCLTWNMMTILFETSFCFWFSLCFLNFTSSKKKKKQDIQETLLQKEEQSIPISTSQDLSLFIETFNCGEKYLTKIDLQTNVPLNKDIYIFSLQECLHPNKSIHAIQQYLNTNYDYHIQSQSIGCNWRVLGYHGTITIIVAVKKTVVEIFNPSTQNTVYEGFNLGCCRLGNKGGAAISLRFPSYSLLVVACHFSSDLKGQNHLEKRNQNAKQVLQSLSPEWLGLNNWDCEYLYDHVIVTGDLNYRINDINTENVFKLIAECAKEEKYEKLLEKDELSLAIHDGKVFTGFKEASIHFPPTFKLNKKEKGICYDFSHLDTIRKVYKTKAKDHTLRIPSYTDRIIWHSLPLYQDAIEPIEDYTMVEEIRKSDHRPVYCQFILHKNEKKRLLQTNPNLVLRLTNLAITSKTNEKVLQSKVCCPLLSDDMNWEQRCISIIKDGFLINNSEQVPLPSLESSGNDSIEHLISSYSSLPLHVALQIQTKNYQGQCILVVNETNEKKGFSAVITNGGEKVGTITGEYSLSNK